MTGLVHRHNGEKQIGCMSTFFHIFDRHQILAGKRVHSAKRLPPSAGVGESPETVSSGDSPEFSQELVKPLPEKQLVVVPDKSKSPPAENVLGRRICPVFNPKEDEKRPPSVIARLMGLDPLRPYDEQPRQSAPIVNPKPASNVSTEFVASKYIDRNNFQLKQPNQLQKQTVVQHVVTYAGDNVTKFDSVKDTRVKTMDKQINELTALKHILEVLQLKGLVHSTYHHSNGDRRRSFVYDRNLHSGEYNVHRKQCGSLASNEDRYRSVTDYKTFNRKRDGGDRGVDRKRNIPTKGRTASPNRIESNLKRCNSIIKRKPLSIEVVDSEGCREGKLLLERCDKLLHSIAEMNSATESPPSSTSSVTVLPSPVSVLDSGFEKDESWSSSDSIDFRGNLKATIDSDTPKISPAKSIESHNEFTSTDPDFIYISTILQNPTIKNQPYDAENTSTDSNRNRKLIFDVIVEIVDRYKQMPPWKATIEQCRPSIEKIWSQFESIREVIAGDGSAELIIKRDFVEIKEWGEYSVETLEAIVDVERLIFKDLVSEAIGDLVNVSGECVFSRTRRKLVF